MLSIGWSWMPRFMGRGFGCGRSDLTAIRPIDVLMKVGFHAALWGRRLFPPPITICQMNSSPDAS